MMLPVTLPLFPNSNTPCLAVAGNHIAAPRRHAADDIGTALDADAGKEIGDGLAAGDVRADVIAANGVPGVSQQINLDAIVGVA